MRFNPASSPFSTAGFYFLYGWIADRRVSFHIEVRLIWNVQRSENESLFGLRRFGIASQDEIDSTDVDSG